MQQTKQTLQAEQIVSLRESGLLKESEYAYIAGDLVIAEDVTSSSKRVLGKAIELLNEGKKRVLLG
jgi:hypothetical protein